MTSFYTSLSGLRNAETDLGVVAHNIANAETTGFKKSSVEFADIVSNGSSGDPRMTRGIGSTVTSINQDFSLGAVEQTGRSLDVAIDGDGFFATRNEESGDIKYSRNGNFQLDGAGFVTDFSDKRLQIFETDANGAVTDPNTTVDAQIPPVNAAGSELSGVTVEVTGMVRAAYADGSTADVGRVALANFLSPNGLRAVGGSKWEATGVSGQASFGVPGVGQFGEMRSGALERSNVNLAEEMVGLITAQRNFQANAKAIDTASQLSQTIINLRS
ncbi:Flagellar basal-body rod protein FlgG [Alteripontixanthobacter maritimus]|uniref:Flagellar hook protein FlgE n=1 Tax=Alteripontixanthobacter maritimus TaxID=2161824 RepID=A0A369Q307_9SPHN|nr:flagellar hook-basal body complex protein [Alteripontixanthobacter maritimus]RDC59154.1 Flagellar basal-body rod protein FlgG [Alteripontixanthobacter maritimus]